MLSKNIVFLEAIMQKNRQMPCQTNEASYNKIYDFFSLTTWKIKTFVYSSDLMHSVVLTLCQKETKQIPLINTFWIAKHRPTPTASCQQTLVNQGIYWYFQLACDAHL